MKVEIYIIVSITARPVGRVVKIYDEAIVYIGNFIMCHTHTDYIQYHVKSVDKISHG